MRLKECAKLCIKHKIDCPNDSCKMWVDYEDDFNCANIAIKKNGNKLKSKINK